MTCIKCNTDNPDTSNYCSQCGKKLTPPDYSSRRTKSRGNGQGTVYKRGKTYTAVYVAGWRWDMTDPSRPVKRRVTRTKGGFSTAAKARAYLPTLMEESTPPSIVTLHHLWQVYSTNAMTKLSRDKQVAYEIAYRRLSEISSLDITTLDIGTLQATVSKNTSTYYPARDMKTVLSHLYKMAATQETVKTNLADYAQGNWWTGYILLMICTGMMPGELMKVTKDMIDFENHVIIGAGLKTKKRKTVPLVMSDVIEPVVAHLIEQTSCEKLIRINKDNFYKIYYETLARCGCRKLTPYSCRHTTATALTLQKIPLSIVQEVMRHSKSTTTQRYIHVGVAPMLDAVNQIQPKKSEQNPLPDKLTTSGTTDIPPEDLDTTGLIDPC